MRPEFLFPRCEGLVILGSISAVVESGRQNISHSGVERSRTPIRLSRKLADFLSNQIKGLVRAESVGAIGQDLREELSEQIVTLQDGAATVGRDINDEFGFALGDGTVDQVSVDCLEVLLLSSASNERVHRQHRNVVVAFTVEEVARVGISGSTDDWRRVSWVRDLSGAGASCTRGRGGRRIRSRRRNRQLFGGLWLTIRKREELPVDVRSRRDVVERCEYTSEVFIRHRCSVGKRESGGLAGVDSSSTTATTESACAGSARAECYLCEGVEKVVPKGIAILETAVLTPVEQEFSGVLTVNFRQGRWCERRIAETRG